LAFCVFLYHHASGFNQKRRQAFTCSYFSIVIRSFVIAEAADTCLKSNSNQSSTTMSMLVSQW
jgi:hypothetical protein